MQTLYTTPLPEAMESLSMRVILRGGQVQSRFLLLPQLTTLDLQFCEMDDEAFAVIGPTIGRRMPSLRTLRLARNRLTDAELGALVGPELALLDCSSNPITSRSAGHLFRAMAFNDRLHEVDLSFTHIDGTLSFVGLNHWTASPALVRIPGCLSDADLLRAQLAGDNLAWDASRKLIDNISTDELTPGWVCYYYDETLAEYCLVGLRGNAVARNDIKRGGFSVIVSGRSKGCELSRWGRLLLDRSAAS
jgi:hypothetical protein